MIRNKFFLTSGQVRFFIVLIVGSFIFASGLVKFLLVVFSLSILFLFRRTDPVFKETKRGEGDMLLSPINGKIRSIKKIYHENNEVEQELIIRMFLKDSWGLYLPFKGEMLTLKHQEGTSIEVKDVEKDFTPASIKNLNMTNLELSSEQSVKAIVSLFPFWGERAPRIWMKSGDRGQGAACLGFMPWGGYCRIVLPAAAEVLAINNEKVEAGQTVLAVLKRESQLGI